jgi:hypothetical protein
MKRLVVASAIALLVAAAGYSIYVAIYASLTAEGYDPSLFWTAIGILFAIAAAALWAASRLYKRHFADVSKSAG